MKTMLTKEARTANKRLAKKRVQWLNQPLVFQIKFCGKSPLIG